MHSGLNDKINSYGINDKIGKVFRAIASADLSACAYVELDCLSSMKILLRGGSEELTLGYVYDALCLVTAERGEELNLCNRSSLLACRAFSCRGKLIGYPEMSNFVLGELDLGEDASDAVSVENGDLLDSTEELFEFDEDEDDNEQFEDTLEDDNKEDKQEEVVEKESKEPEENDSEEDEKILNEKIYKFYSAYAQGIIAELIKRYTSLFSSGYEVIKPYGILCSEGVISLSSNSRVVKEDSVVTSNMYQIFNSKMNFEECELRSIRSVANYLYKSYTEGNGKLVYLPNKLLEFAYGRCAPTGIDQESLSTYTKHASSSSWNGYVRDELEKSIKMLVKQLMIAYVSVQRQQDEDYRSNRLQEGVKKFLVYIQECMSVCLLLVEYKSSNLSGEKKITSFKVRVCDPEDRLGIDNLTGRILSECFMGGVGKVPFSYPVRLESEVFVKEYAHEFNHDISQAMPLFAYKALESIQAQGLSLSWDSTILGTFEDGSILRNGVHGVDLKRCLFHHANAGSRAGKGVMTLNILASAIASGIPVFYADRKPDMSSMLKYLAPNMCVVNGGGYDKQYDMKYQQFTTLDSALGVENVPDMALDAFGVKVRSWDVLGDVVYMRFLKLMMGIVLARASGKFSDANYGGEKGLMIVFDEFSNFQNAFMSLISTVASKVPPTTIEKDTINKEKGSVTVNQFNNSYNDGNYYALSYLNSLNEDLKFVGQKVNAGFNPIEAEYSNVFIIGQSLENCQMNANEFAEAIQNSPGSSRYRSAGSCGLKSFSLGMRSIPLNLVGFREADAFFGYNKGLPKYLAQTNASSKAKGRLDEKARNFAYCPSFTEETRARMSGGRVQDNISIADSCVYFKPFLILNTGDPQDECVTTLFNNCASGGVSRDDLISEYPNNTGDGLNPAIGFESYLNMAGISNYREVLESSSNIANYVVRNCLGYSGDWFQFVTDLRPEWIFSVRDVCDGAINGSCALSNPKDNPVTAEFYEFNPDVFGGSGSVDSEGMTEGYESGVDRFFSEPSETFDDYFDPQKVEEEYQDRLSDAIEDDDDDEPLFFDDDEKIDIFGDNTKDDDLGDIENTVYDSKSRDETIDRLLSQIAEMQNELNALKGNTQNSGSPVDVSAVYSGETFAKTPNSDLGDAIGGLDYSDDALTLKDLMEIVTENIKKNFGGFERFNSFKVVGGSIVVNNYCVSCSVNNFYAKDIPYDIKKDINTGNISKLFIYKSLFSMGNLRSLDFDSASFVLDYVCPVFGVKGGILGVDRFFEEIPSLFELKIGNDVFTRNDYQTKMRESDVFYKPRKSTEIADTCEVVLGNISHSSWEWGKSVASKKNYNKALRVLGITAGGAVAATAMIGKQGTKLGRKAFSTGAKAIKNGFRNLFDH